MAGFSMRKVGSGASRRPAEPDGDRTSLLESNEITVTGPREEISSWYEIAKCRCDCWFCPDCCASKGLALMNRLIPILETFTDLRLFTFTVDPTLFESPSEAYLYLMDNRCISVTVQELDRRGYLYSRRYFYVVEWQKETKQAHFHVLVDAKYIPIAELVGIWGKHRPKDAGPVEGERPPFGTVYISRRGFAGGATHAARYLCKYLTKYPEVGFPDWVLELGSDRRVRRYSTSRGFWGEKTERKRPGRKRSVGPRLNYAQRISGCGSSINMFRACEFFVLNDGEIHEERRWIGELDIDAEIIAKVAGETETTKRCTVPGDCAGDVVNAVEKAAGRRVAGRWAGGGSRERVCDDE